ncbi:hypothetical protein JTB14_008828 [Gonioctena quinquepunctata]|nr:hypothetical protein JTB14_008828 [Gonioctena quinquepunctata]
MYDEYYLKVDDPDTQELELHNTDDEYYLFSKHFKTFVIKYVKVNVSSYFPMPFHNVDYEIAKSDNREEILEFLRKFFFKDEPVNKYLGLVNDNKPINEEVEDFSMDDFDDGLSLLARENGKLIGLCLSGILKKGSKLPHTCRDEKFSKLLELFNHIGREADPFEKYPQCTKAVNVGILSVDESHRRKGIAKSLLEKTR